MPPINRPLLELALYEYSIHNPMTVYSGDDIFSCKTYPFRYSRPLLVCRDGASGPESYIHI